MLLLQCCLKNVLTQAQIFSWEFQHEWVNTAMYQKPEHMWHLSITLPQKDVCRGPA